MAWATPATWAPTARVRVRVLDGHGAATVRASLPPHYAEATAGTPVLTRGRVAFSVSGYDYTSRRRYAAVVSARLPARVRWSAGRGGRATR